MRGSSTVTKIKACTQLIKILYLPIPTSTFTILVIIGQYRPSIRAQSHEMNLRPDWQSTEVPEVQNKTQTYERPVPRFFRNNFIEIKPI